MPIEYLTEGFQGHKKSKYMQSFPSPRKHLEHQKNWRTFHNVTASSHNGVHHKSQREYFDRPIFAPDRGYSHERKEKTPFNAIYSKITPMRSIGHAKQLMRCFKAIEEEENDIKSAKWRGFGSPVMIAGQSSPGDPRSKTWLSKPIGRKMLLADDNEGSTSQVVLNEAQVT